MTSSYLLHLQSAWSEISGAGPNPVEVGLLRFRDKQRRGYFNMLSSRSRHHVCGLVIKQDQRPVPLRDVSVEAEINGYVLGLTSVLKYTNESPDPIEVLFRFPLEDSSAVVGLTAVIDGRKIKAEIREKEEARAAYDDALASGQSAALGEEKSGDIFSISLGNLPSKKDADIYLKVVSELPIDAEENVRFSLPSVLKPRYAPAGSSDPLSGISSGAEVQVETGRVAGFSGFKLSVLNGANISEVTSPTHAIRCAEVGDKMNISLTDEKPAEKDLVILVKHKNSHQPSAVVEQGKKNGSEFMSREAVMVNFFPEFGKLEDDCEFIFLVDRSGSMSGNFIKSARETLILFMKSLPENCWFNIVGFGSRYEKLFPDVSVPYSQSTLDTAVAHLTSLEADLGGTELLSPLDFIFRTKPSSGLSRQLFVLTDGAVSNTNACIAKVKQNEKNSRCFTFGIGSGASTALVEGLARAGNGSAEFVKEGERLQPKVIRSLKRALQPAVTNVTLEFKVDGKADVLQCPQSLPPIYSGEKLVAYGIVKAKNNEITGKAILKGKLLGSLINYLIPFSSKPSLEDVSPLQTIHHLAAKTLIKEWECERKGKNEIVKLSVETSVISSQTAFIAIDEENSKPIEGALKTWDIQTCNFLVRSGRGSGLKRKTCKHRSINRSRQRSIKKSGKKCIKKCAKRSIKKSGKRKRSRDDDDDEEELAIKVKRKRMISKPLKQVPLSYPEVNLSSIITAQQANGSWKMSQTLLRFLGKSLQNIETACPTNCKGLVATVWTTLLILELLRTKFLDDEDEWELVGNKAESWTKKQSLPKGLSLGQMQAAASNFMT